MRSSSPSPFTSLESSFVVLCTAAEPLALDTRGLTAALPQRLVPLTELRELLLRRDVDYGTRDTALTALVGNARAHGGAWTVGVAGVLLPGLRRVVGPLSAACPAYRSDLEAEALLGLVEGVASINTDGGRIAARLQWAAARRAHRLLNNELPLAARDLGEPPDVVAPTSGSHADLALAAALAEGVVTRAEAVLIGETRIGGVPVREYAASVGANYHAVVVRRARAEARLVAWLRTRQGSDAGPDPDGRRVGRGKTASRDDDRRRAACQHVRTAS